MEVKKRARLVVAEDGVGKRNEDVDARDESGYESVPIAEVGLQIPK